MTHSIQRTTPLVAAALLTAALSGVNGYAQQAGEQTFPSPQAAGQALLDATVQNDIAALMKIFGPQADDIVQSGDAANDAEAHAQFAARAREKLEYEIDPSNPARAVIIAGNQNWPFPVPLLRNKAGQWYFDTLRGRTEILARRIGGNELAAIDVCRAYVEAQMEYASRDRDANGVLEYAQKIMSSPGKKDGLYFEGEPDNLVPKAFADAAAAMFAEGKKPVPYHGYYFHILKAQGADAQGGSRNYVVKGQMIGGFAMLAYPAQYGESGIKTFIVNHSGVVYEKDLGPTTGAAAPQMTRFNPDKTWKPVEGE